MASNEKNNILSFKDTDNKDVEFEVIEQTTINGNNYLLVCENNDSDESMAYILKEIKKNDDDIVYDEVIDDVELQAVGKVFDELLDEGFDMQIG